MHYLANKAARNASATAWAAANKSKTRKANTDYHHRNKAVRAEQSRQWVVVNRAARRAIDAKRKAAKKQAIPIWVDMQEVRKVYVRARNAEQASGQRMHVDHIVPLQSPLVCGLHWHGNLQVLPGSQNEAKKNYWWPDMPSIEQAAKQGQLFEPVPVKQEQMNLESV
jgi:hypothetical protein